MAECYSYSRMNSDMPEGSSPAIGFTPSHPGITGRRKFLATQYEGGIHANGGTKQVFVLLLLEMSIFMLLILPLPFTWRKKIFRFISESALVAKLQYGMKITFIFILILFIDSVRANPPSPRAPPLLGILSTLDWSNNME